MDGRDTRQARRWRRRTHKPQAAAASSAPGTLSTGSARRGLAARYFGALVQRRALRALTTPAAAGLVAVAVVAVFAALAIGTVIGMAMAQHQGRGYE
jgi:hypothetical protein